MLNRLLEPLPRTADALRYTSMSTHELKGFHENAVAYDGHPYQTAKELEQRFHIADYVGLCAIRLRQYSWGYGQYEGLRYEERLHQEWWVLRPVAEQEERGLSHPPQPVFSNEDFLARNRVHAQPHTSASCVSDAELRLPMMPPAVYIIGRGTLEAIKALNENTPNDFADEVSRRRALGNGQYVGFRVASFGLVGPPLNAEMRAAPHPSAPTESFAAMTDDSVYFKVGLSWTAARPEVVIYTREQRGLEIVTSDPITPYPQHPSH